MALVFKHRTSEICVWCSDYLFRHHLGVGGGHSNSQTADFYREHEPTFVCFVLSKLSIVESK